MPHTEGSVRVVHVSHEHTSVSGNRLKSSLVFSLDADLTEHGVGGGVAVETDPAGVPDALRPAILALRTHVLDLLGIADLDDLDHGVVERDQCGVRSRELMQLVAEGTLHAVSLAGVDADQLHQAPGTVGVSTAEDPRHGPVVSAVLLIADRALQNLDF